jgi:toluene monooxygenase system protein E
MTDAPPQVLPPLRTWSHLAGNKKRPTEYEVVSVKLHYHTDNQTAWELDPDVFMNRWYREHCGGSPLTHPDWDAFRDPEEVVYRTYIAKQDDQETYVMAMLDEHDRLGHDASLGAEWVAALARWYTPSRYPAHLLQMAAAYVGQMAPASTITTPLYMQAADEMRQVQHTAYRTCELANHHPDAGFATGERDRWENDSIWQGFRELLERLLVTWDWAEAFVALNLVAKPMYDQAILRQLGATADASGDRVLRYLADSHLADSARSRRLSSALVAMTLMQPGNRELIVGWIGKWLPLAEQAARGYLAGLPGATAGQADDAIGDVLDWHRQLGLS